MSAFGRRDYMAAVASAAAGVRLAEGNDLENVDEWEELAGTYETGSFAPELYYASGFGNLGSYHVDPEDVDELVLSVFYDSNNVNLNVEGERGDELTSGALVGLSTDEAREVAAAIYAAAEELDARRDAEGAGHAETGP